MRDLTYAPEALDGRTVYSSDDEKLGKVDDVMVDADGVPVYVETKKGLFSGRRHSLKRGSMSFSMLLPSKPSLMGPAMA